MNTIDTDDIEAEARFSRRRQAHTAWHEREYGFPPDEQLEPGAPDPCCPKCYGPVSFHAGLGGYYCCDRCERTWSLSDVDADEVTPADLRERARVLKAIENRLEDK